MHLGINPDVIDMAFITFRNLSIPKVCRQERYHNYGMILVPKASQVGCGYMPWMGGEARQGYL